MMLYKLLEEKVKDVTLLMMLLEFNIMLLSNCSGFLKSLNLVKVNISIFSYALFYNYSIVLQNVSK